MNALDAKECLHVCPSEAISVKDEEGSHSALQHKCDRCERCIPICPVKAIRGGIYAIEIKAFYFHKYFL